MVKDCKDLAFRRNVCSGRPDLIGSLGPRHILQKQEKLKFTMNNIFQTKKNLYLKLKRGSPFDQEMKAACLNLVIVATEPFKKN